MKMVSTSPGSVERRSVTAKADLGPISPPPPPPFDSPLVPVRDDNIHPMPETLTPLMRFFCSDLTEFYWVSIDPIRLYWDLITLFAVLKRLNSTKLFLFFLGCTF